MRCLAESAGKIAEAPDGSRAWEVYRCERCNYSWRSSEDSEVAVLQKRDPEFQLGYLDLDSLGMFNLIPPLKK